MLHASHRCALYRGLVWCWKCGATATLASTDSTSGRAGLQADECRPNGISVGRAASLHRLRQGLPPRSRRPWPLLEEAWEGAFPTEMSQGSDAGVFDAGGHTSPSAQVTPPPDPLRAETVEASSQAVDVGEELSARDLAFAGDECLFAFHELQCDDEEGEEDPLGLGFALD